MLPFHSPSLSFLPTIASRNQTESQPQKALQIQAKIANPNAQPPIWNDFAPVSPGVWHGVGAVTDIAGFHIQDGCIYVGEILTGRREEFQDPCLINPSLPVSKPTTTVPPLKPNQINYQTLTPEQRYQYLQWLSDGKNDPNIESGYILLYLYGLERRLIIDGPRENFSTNEKLLLTQELQKLSNLYQNRPEIIKPVSQLMCLSWIADRNPNSNEPLPGFLDFGQAECKAFFPWLLARYVTQKRPVPAIVFLYWYDYHPDFGLKGAAKILPDYFTQVFVQQFERSFGPGIIVSPNKTTLQISHTLTNPAIGRITFTFPYICDVFLEKSILSHMLPIIYAINNEFDPIIEYIHQHDDYDITSPGFIARLPTEIYIHHPSAQNLKAQLIQLLNENNGMIMLNVRSLYTAIGCQYPTQNLTRQQLDDWEKLLSRMGFIYAPNYRLHGIPLNPDGYIVISGSNAQIELSRPFATMAVILRLGTMVAQSDNEICQAEIDVLQNIVRERRVLSKPEQESLILLLHWCLNTPQSLADVENRIEKLPESTMEYISRILVNVSCADGVVKPAEHDILAKIYMKLGIPATQADEDIKLCLKGELPISQKRQDNTPDYNQPDYSQAESRNCIAISNDLNKALASICTEAVPVNPPSEPVMKPEADAEPAPIIQLDESHIRFLREISDYSTIQRLDFFILAVKHCLMGDRVIQAVNSWAMSREIMPLITDGETVVQIDNQRLKLYLGES